MNTIMCGPIYLATITKDFNAQLPLLYNNMVVTITIRYFATLTAPLHRTEMLYLETIPLCRDGNSGQVLPYQLCQTSALPANKGFQETRSL